MGTFSALYHGSEPSFVIVAQVAATAGAMVFYAEWNASPQKPQPAHKYQQSPWPLALLARDFILYLCAILAPQMWLPELAAAQLTLPTAEVAIPTGKTGRLSAHSLDQELEENIQGLQAAVLKPLSIQLATAPQSYCWPNQALTFIWRDTGQKFQLGLVDWDTSWTLLC